MKHLLNVLLMLCSLLPALSSAPATAAPLSSKLALFTSDDDGILPPDEAFKLEVGSIRQDTLQAVFQIAPGHYLYRDRIKFSSATPGVTVTDISMPPGESKKDPSFGTTYVFHRETEAKIQLAFSGDVPAILKLNATYQGCSEKGLCYPPIHKILDVSLGGDATEQSTTTPPPEQDRIAGLLGSGKLWLILSGFFGIGLLLAFTPCMLPMIPILSGIIVGSKSHGHGSKGHAILLSAAYVFGMSLSYTLAGIAAGLSGQLLSNALQTPWVLGATALLFVLLALSMFGFYEIRLPQSLADRLTGTNSRIRGGHFAGVFLMGVVSALIVSPCVAAPLAGALLYISQTRDVWLGGSALFALSLGMGLPLLLIGASAGSLLPKAGPWMERIRQLFGVVMLYVALLLISPVIPLPVQMALWAALLIVPAIFLHALDRLPETATGWQRVWKGLGIILFLLGVMMLIGAFSGAKSPLQPLSGFNTANLQKASTATALPFKRIHSLEELQQSLADAKGKIVMLDFYADWCVACKELEQFTFSDPRVQQSLENVVLLQADVTQNTPADAALLQRFQLFGPPAILFFHGQDQRDPKLKLIGYQNSEQFLRARHTLGCETGIAYC